MCLIRLSILLGAFTLGCSSCQWKALMRAQTTTEEADSASEPPARIEVGARDSAARTVTSVFRPSLEMKENADFLLTPALMVQQAIVADGPIVYPSE
jgi:hypothetical protein